MEGQARERYDSGSVAHFEASVMPLRPVIGKEGICETSKPVAQTITSSSWNFPSEVWIPLLLI